MSAAYVERVVAALRELDPGSDPAMFGWLMLDCPSFSMIGCPSREAVVSAVPAAMPSGWSLDCDPLFVHVIDPSGWLTPWGSRAVLAFASLSVCPVEHLADNIDLVDERLRETVLRLADGWHGSVEALIETAELLCDGAAAC